MPCFLPRGPEQGYGVEHYAPHAHTSAARVLRRVLSIMIAIGFLDTLADPEEGRRVLASCGVKVTRVRSTLTALVVWFVLVSVVRALAITVFEVITDFNAEAGNPENGKV